MNASPRIATVFGGSGFVGRYVCQRLARAGWRIRVAVRRPDEAFFVRPYGTVGQIEILQANIRDEDSTRRAIVGSDVVINCVGILGERGSQTFDSVIGEGAERIARISSEENVARLIHVSAIGADAGSSSEYARNKAEAERAVLKYFPNAVIFRPSIIFGTEDEFFNRFAGMARISPVIPVVSPETRFQPVYVDDVAAAIVKAADGNAEPGIYELGGPEVASFGVLLRQMLTVIERKRFVLSMPIRLARLNGRLLDFLQRATFGLFTNSILTADQVEMLQVDNVVSDGAKGFANLGLVPTNMDAVLEGYLHCYRPHGQYDAITASAKKLKT